MQLAELLSLDEASTLQKRIDATDPAKSAFVRIDSETNGIAVVCICSGGRVLTWFASPYKTGLDADAVEAVIQGGVRAVQMEMATRMEQRLSHLHVDPAARH